MPSRWRMLRLLFCILSLILATQGSAQAIFCTVTQEAGQTCYRVPGFKGDDCQYSWNNGTGHVMANHEEKIEDLVVIQNITSITTNRCIKEISYMRDCISEGIRQGVTCSTNCSGNAGLLQKKGDGDENKSDIHYYWIPAAVVAIIVLLLVGLVIYIVCCRKRHCYKSVTSNEEAPRG